MESIVRDVLEVTQPVQDKPDKPLESGDLSVGVSVEKFHSPSTEMNIRSFSCGGKHTYWSTSCGPIGTYIFLTLPSTFELRCLLCRLTFRYSISYVTSLFSWWCTSSRVELSDTFSRWIARLRTAQPRLSVTVCVDDSAVCAWHCVLCVEFRFILPGACRRTGGTCVSDPPARVG